MNNNYFISSFPPFLCLSQTLTSINSGFTYLTGSLAIEACQSNLYPMISQLTLQENFFTGALHKIFNVSQKHQISALALSSNDLTGTISGRFLQSASMLVIYSIGSNCLSGTIPGEICDLFLLEFSMDGASTSKRCRRQIVNIPSLGLNADVSFHCKVTYEYVPFL